ncbi:MAG: DUF1365 domain-containing protein [Pseudomonadota bacterium]
MSLRDDERPTRGDKAGAAPHGVDAFAPRLFVGHVMHMRLKPARHRFRHSVVSLWLDVDRLAETARRLRFFGYNKPALFGFRDADHGPRDGRPLRPWVEAQLARISAPPPARLMLLCFPRVLGYVFNPLSVYYGYDADGRLSSIVYEVKNTIGGQHAYAARLDAADEAEAAPRHARDKAFYVSPFIGMDKTYRFTAPPPGERLALRIKEADAAGDELIATWSGRAEPLSDARIARRFATHPALGFRVIALIHWHALRLALKGVPMIGRRMASPAAQRGESAAYAAENGAAPSGRRV